MQGRWTYLASWLFLLCAYLAFVGCSRKETTTRRVPLERTTQPLPELPAGDKDFSSYKPANPYQEISPILLTRTMFEAAGPTGYRIEVRDLRVDARKKAENITLPGAAFFEVQEGSGVLTLAGKQQQLPSGSTFTVSQGQAFSLESSSDQPLIIRACLLRAE